MREQKSLRITFSYELWRDLIRLRDAWWYRAHGPELPVMKMPDFIVHFLSVFVSHCIADLEEEAAE